MVEREELSVATARWRGAAQVGNIAAARGGVLAFAEEHGVAETTRRDVGVAVAEVLTNVVRHAYGADDAGELEVDAATDGECLTVRIADNGRGATGEPVGLGLQLVRGMADRIEVGPTWEGC